MDTMRRKQRGLTLVELMVTLAVAIILLAVGMPLFTGVVDSNRATTQANSLVAALKLARSEAVKRSDDVTVCAGDGSACGGADDWADGWFVHTDVNDSGGFDAPDVLRRWEALSNSSAIKVTGGDSVKFKASGEPSGKLTFETNNTSASGADKDTAKRCVTVTVSGQIRAAKGACS